MVKRVAVWALCLCLLVSLGMGAQASDAGGAPRYVFLFIGDGMGLSITTLAQYYMGYLQQPDARPPLMPPLSFTTFPHIGLMSTHYYSGWVTDSSAAATAMASGQKTRKGYSNLSPDESEAYTPLTFAAKAAGKKVGIVTTTAVTDGTPAGFFATTASRDDHYGLAVQAAQSDIIDFLGGGGFRVYKDPDGEGENAYDLAEQNGYRIIEDQDEIRALTASQARYFVLADERTSKSEMQFEIDRHYREQFGDEAVSLAEVVDAAIRVMDGPDGFFLMAEGGRIDGAAHTGDVKTAICEVIGLSDAVAVAIDFYREHPDETLIVVTSDHETGGVYFTSALDMDVLRVQDVSYSMLSTRSKEILAQGGSFDDVLSWMSRHLGMDEDPGARVELSGEERAYLEHLLTISQLPSEEREAFADDLAPYVGYNAFVCATMDLLGAAAGVFLGTSGHTGTQVPVYALGVHAGQFGGCYDNTQLYAKLMEIMGL